jgi:hypothetical protein
MTWWRESLSGLAPWFAVYEFVLLPLRFVAVPVFENHYRLNAADAVEDVRWCSATRLGLFYRNVFGQKISTNGSSGTVHDLPLATFVDTTCLTISLPATRCLPFLKQLYPDCRTPSLWRILKNADLPQANRLDRPFPSCFGVN